MHLLKPETVVPPDPRLLKFRQLLAEYVKRITALMENYVTCEALVKCRHKEGEEFIPNFNDFHVFLLEEIHRFNRNVDVARKNAKRQTVDFNTTPFYLFEATLEGLVNALREEGERLWVQAAYTYDAWQAIREITKFTEKNKMVGVMIIHIQFILDKNKQHIKERQNQMSYHRAERQKDMKIQTKRMCYSVKDKPDEVKKLKDKELVMLQKFEDEKFYWQLCKPYEVMEKIYEEKTLKKHPAKQELTLIQDETRVPVVDGSTGNLTEKIAAVSLTTTMTTTVPTTTTTETTTTTTTVNLDRRKSTEVGMSFDPLMKYVKEKRQSSVPAPPRHNGPAPPYYSQEDIEKMRKEERRRSCSTTRAAEMAAALFPKHTPHPMQSNRPNPPPPKQIPLERVQEHREPSDHQEDREMVPPRYHQGAPPEPQRRGVPYYRAAYRRADLPSMQQPNRHPSPLTPSTSTSSSQLLAPPQSPQGSPFRPQSRLPMASHRAIAAGINPADVGTMPQRPPAYRIPQQPAPRHYSPQNQMPGPSAHPSQQVHHPLANPRSPMPSNFRPVRMIGTLRPSQSGIHSITRSYVYQGGASSSLSSGTLTSSGTPGASELAGTGPSGQSGSQNPQPPLSPEVDPVGGIDSGPESHGFDDVDTSGGAPQPSIAAIDSPGASEKEQTP